MPDLERPSAVAGRSPDRGRLLVVAALLWALVLCALASLSLLSGS